MVNIPKVHYFGLKEIRTNQISHFFSTFSLVEIYLELGRHVSPLGWKKRKGIPYPQHPAASEYNTGVGNQNNSHSGRKILIIKENIYKSVGFFITIYFNIINNQFYTNS